MKSGVGWFKLVFLYLGWDWTSFWVFITCFFFLWTSCHLPFFGLFLLNGKSHWPWIWCVGISVLLPIPPSVAHLMSPGLKFIALRAWCGIGITKYLWNEMGSASGSQVVSEADRFGDKGKDQRSLQNCIGDFLCLESCICALSPLRGARILALPYLAFSEVRVQFEALSLRGNGWLLLRGSSERLRTQIIMIYLLGLIYLLSSFVPGHLQMLLDLAFVLGAPSDPTGSLCELGSSISCD